MATVAGSDSDQRQLMADRPLDPSVGDIDRLGFQPLASRLAHSIVSEASSDGLVIGLEGAWGSGKSSLTALTTLALKELPDETRPETIDFRPWLIGSRDALLAALFGDLQKAIDKISLRGGDATGVTKTASLKAADQMRKFVTRLEPLGSAFELAAAANPIFGVIGGLVKASAKAAREAEKGPSITTLKKQLDEALGALPVKIVVVIDDVDRLEPSEVMELLRLVRSVADFKNIVYVLCFDPSVLSEAVRVAAKVDDGRSYLEKIIQVSVPVPAPEPFLLRRWFETSVQGMISSLSDEESARLRRVIDAEGGRRLTTPRSVVRTLNAVYFTWSALKGQVDVPDLVWLQLIRTNSPALYRWIESYVSAMALTRSSRATVLEDSKNADSARLFEIMKGDDRTPDHILNEFEEHLLGMNEEMGKKGVRLYKSVSAHDWDKAVNGNRLSSPDHYRLYFALQLPPLSLTSVELGKYNEAVNVSLGETERLLAEWFKEKDGTGFSKGEAFLERLKSIKAEGFKPDEAENLLLSFSEIMDDVAKEDTGDDWLGPAGWRQAERLLPQLLQALGEDRRRRVLVKMFSEGSSIGWLTSIFRTEYFAHGLYGDQRRHEDEWDFTSDELSEVTSVIIHRFESLGIYGLIDIYRSASSLFAWKQMGEQSLAPYLAEAIHSDKGFLSLLKVLRSHVRSTGGNYWHISRESLSFLSTDPREIEARVETLMNSSDASIADEAEAVLHLLRPKDGWN